MTVLEAPSPSEELLQRITTKQGLSFVYAKGGDYKIGQHTVELYEGGALMGKTTFTLK